MIEIKITGNSMDEIRAKAFMICGVPSIATTLPAHAPVHISSAAPGAVNHYGTNGSGEKRPPGRPRKNPLPEQHENLNLAPLAAPAVPSQAPPAAAKEPTLEETKHAVNRVLEAKGVKVAHECIKHFGANRITELAKDKWQALIEHCNGVMG